jgi:glucokinase
MKNQARFLVADIGGTHCRFALFSAAPLSMLGQCRVPSAGISFDTVLDRARLAQPALFEHKAQLCVLAVAGIVLGQHSVALSNLPYTISAEQCQAVAEKVVFINDFAAQAYACLGSALQGAALLWAGSGAHKPKAVAAGRYAVIGAGTGLGTAFLHKEEHTGWQVFASEGGHATLPLISREELALGEFLCQRKGKDFLYWEDVLSGSGLALLHEWLTGEASQPQAITAQQGFARSKTCALFALFYGRYCHDVALQSLSRSGIVLTGGVAAACPALVQHPAFAKALHCCTPAYAAWLRGLPLWHSSHDDTGLWGAAHYAASL